MEEEVGPVAAAGPDDGTGAVLYGMFTSFTEALGDLDGRLAAIEAAVLAGSPEMASRLAALEAATRTVPAELTSRLAALEASLDELSGVLREVADAVPAPGSVAAGAADFGAAESAEEARAVVVGDQLLRQSDLLERRTADLAAAVDSVRALVQSHMDDTAHSLGRRAGEAGRRLASDLGLRGRPKPPAVGS